MSSAPGSPAVDDGVPRQPRTLTVHRPWAWCWWPANHPLVLEDPDITHGQRRRPSVIGGLKVDWTLINDAVRFAVGSCPVGSEALHLDAITVEVPFGLSGDEHEIAESWVGYEVPVVYRYEDNVVEDGRHRLWLSRGHTRGNAMPVLASNLLQLRTALTGMPHLAPAFTETMLPAADAWWKTAPDDLIECNEEHRRMLAHAYAQLCAPAPIPPGWFYRLAPWDRHLEMLAEFHRDGRADTALINDVLPHAWRYRQDDASVDRATAIELFRAVHEDVGFSIRGNAFPRPRGSLTLFRGATTENRHGLSWTANPNTARDFAHQRQAPHARAELWKVQIPAERCLMFFPDEDEFIVDLDGLEHLVHKDMGQDRPGLRTRTQVAWLKHHANRRS